MRIIIVAAALLAGCATPEQQAQWQMERDIEATKRAVYRSSPAGQADLGCQAKTQFAMAGWRARSILDLEGTARANQMHATCMDYWRRTGQLP
jgi:hypothetical protein